MVVFNHNISMITCKPVFSYDSQCIIIACGSQIKVFAIKSGECIQILRHHSRPVISIRENKKNDLQIFSCSEDGVVVRWDYMDGKMLQVYDLQMTVTSFYVPTASEPWFITKKHEDHYRLYSIVPRSEGTKKMEMILKPILPEQNSVDFGCMLRYCASIHENILTIYKFEEKSIKRHKTGKRNLTCVACHPSDFILATGDDQGRVTLWSNALYSNNPIKSIYHWHTLPVLDLAFSSEGSHLHSGGGEAALIKWNLFSEERFILPRMGAPIVYVNPSRENRYVITAHQDNVLQVVDAQRNIVQVIQGLTRCQPQQNATVIPTGLLYNAHLKALVMNGKPGHLQFYDILQDKLLFNLDIGGRNIMTQERDNKVFNNDVRKAAVDDLGRWLATIEYWCDGNTSPQIWLKFWLYDVEKQTFVLNTEVNLPHREEVNAVVFRPQSLSPMAATTSRDGRFKIWRLSDDASDDKHSWSCDAMGSYRDIPAGGACFSEEGSLLAVSFGTVATLWSTEATVLKAVLCNERKKNIRQLLFGRHSCRQFLVCQDGVSITVWNVLTLSIAWIVHNDVQVLAADVLSSSIAAFCKDQHLILFTPDDPKPIRSFASVSDTSVVSAIFVPNPNAERGESHCFQDKSQLFFINEAQNLLTVSESEEPKEELLTSKMKIGVETPFGMLQADKKVSHVQKAEPELLDVATQRKEHKGQELSTILIQSLLKKILG